MQPIGWNRIGEEEDDQLEEQELQVIFQSSYIEKKIKRNWMEQDYGEVCNQPDLLLKQKLANQVFWLNWGIVDKLLINSCLLTVSNAEDQK